MAKFSGNSVYPVADGGLVLNNTKISFWGAVYFVEKINTDYHCRDAVDAWCRDSDERVDIVFQTGNRSDRIFSF